MKAEGYCRWQSYQRLAPAEDLEESKNSMPVKRTMRLKAAGF